MLTNHCANISNKVARSKKEQANPFPSHEDQLANLSRIEGQVRGIARMIEERRYCLDILNQLRSVHAALEGVEKRIFHRFMQTCVKEAFLNSKNGDIEPLIDQIVTLLNRR
ncbi:MAG: metal-sensitive transcriptional regulator [Deltaproteobacteria bacterium]|nr:metal-sensitive transcriptional regulator [Deltaproteobacteria bacterium]